MNHDQPGMNRDQPGMNHDQQAEPRPKQTHGGHGWLMIACCVPMLVIAVVLVATGVVGPGFLFVAIVCTAMMALMMRGMSNTDGGGGGSHH